MQARRPLIFRICRSCVPAFAIILTACAESPQSAGAPFDPYEAANRKVYNLNASLPGGGGSRFPPEIRQTARNIAHNLSMPSVAVNSLLQGDLRGASVASYRFAINSTIGMAGIADAVSEFGGPDHDTDFGETLHVWGAGEGAYLVLPLFGPTTTRDAVGRVVDTVIDPLDTVIKSPGSTYVKGIKIGAAALNGELSISYEADRDAFLTKRRNQLAR